MDVREVMRSESEKVNVAATFRTFQRLKGNPAELVMAKLLLLGSGRCGKTTIRKALRWYDLPPEERHDGENEKDSPNPARNQVSTSNIHFEAWPTGFDFTAGASKPGTVHVWDFAGQEVYHNTHRLFASQGAVFVIATTDTKTHEQRVTSEMEELEEAERVRYKNENENRELKYWLDYIRNALGIADLNEMKEKAGRVKILIVHTGCTDLSRAKELLMKQAGIYSSLIASGDLRLEVIDFQVMEKGKAERDFQCIRDWVKSAVGHAANSLGIRVPELFVKAAAVFALRLTDDNREDQEVSFGEWEVLVDGVFAKPGRATEKKLRREHAEVVARHLHQCGRIFWLKTLQSSVAASRVIIDQRWGIDLIYTLIKPRQMVDWSGLTGTLFGEADLKARLEAVREYREKLPLKSPDQWQLFLSILDQCDICVRTGDWWMAMQPELLPKLTRKKEEELTGAWLTVQREMKSPCNHTYSVYGNQNGLLGNSDYRAVVAWLVRGLTSYVPDHLLGKEEGRPPAGNMDWREGSEGEVHSQCWFCKNTCQIHLLRKQKSGEMEQIVLRVEWYPCVDPTSKLRKFEGGIFVQLLCTDEETYEARLKEALFGAMGPLSYFADKHEISDKLDDFSKQTMPGAPRGLGGPDWIGRDGSPPKAGLRHAVALSYSSKDKALAEVIVAALKRAGIHYYCYDDDLRQNLKDGEEPAFISEIFDYLKYARVLLVIGSEDYFKTPGLEPSRSNLYIPVELADAIVANTCGYTEAECKAKDIQHQKRQAKQIFWIRENTPRFPTASYLDDLVRQMITCYKENVVKPRRCGDPAEDKRLELIKRMEQPFLVCGVDQMKDFMDKTGPDAKQIRTLDRTDEVSLAGFVLEIRQALK